MSMILSVEEIEQLRVKLSAHPAAIAAIDTIDDCDGDLEDAAITLAIQVGMEPNTSDRWLDGLAKRWRAVICQSELREQLAQEVTADAIAALAAKTSLPLKLATPVAIYVIKTGTTSFCEPLEEKLQ